MRGKLQVGTITLTLSMLGLIPLITTTCFAFWVAICIPEMSKLPDPCLQGAALGAPDLI